MFTVGKVFYCTRLILQEFIAVPCSAMCDKNTYAFAEASYNIENMYVLTSIKLELKVGALCVD